MANDGEEFVVGWSIGEIVAWSRLDMSGRFIEWGECRSHNIDEVIRYLGRNKCWVFAERIGDKIARNCGDHCVRSSQSIRKQWPKLQWIVPQAWRQPGFMKSIILPHNTVSVPRKLSFFVANYGLLLIQREQRLEGRKK